MWSTPASPGPAVLASAATGIAEHVAGHGGDIDRICGRAAVDPGMLGQPTLSLDLSAFVGLFEEAARQTRNDNFGLRFGKAFKPRDLGLIGYASVSSPTLGAALENLVTLFPHHQQSSLMRLAPTEDDLVRLEYRIHVPEILERRQDAELSLGMYLNIIREACGPAWAPEEVHFEHPKPENWSEHEAVFDAPVYFSQPANALILRRSHLATPMPAPDLKLLSIARLCLMSVGARPQPRHSLTDQVKIAVRAELARGYPALETISEKVRATPAAIQRELAGENFTYKDIVEEIRKELSFVYLRQRDLPLSEIAFLLGYSELSAFSRAFSRWTGQPPRLYRLSLEKRLG